MADEYSKPPHNRILPIPSAYNWESLTNKKGAELELHYATLLGELSTAKGILGQIFTKSQNKIQDPAMLAKIIDMINNGQWLVMGADVKGDIYEKLLEQNAQDVKIGNESVAGKRRLVLMNLFLHNIGDIESDNFISPADALIAASPITYDYVLANPPFGKKVRRLLRMMKGSKRKMI